MISVLMFSTPPVELFGGVLLPSNIWINCNNPSDEEDFSESTSLPNCLLLLLLPKPESQSSRHPITVTTLPSCNYCYAYFSSENGLNTHVSTIAACRRLQLPE